MELKGVVIDVEAAVVILENGELGRIDKELLNKSSEFCCVNDNET